MIKKALFKKEDFNNLYFTRVMELANSNHTELRGMPRFEGVPLKPLHNQQVVQITKYCVLMYDKGSPLIEKYSDLKIRKEKAIDIVGISRYDQKALIQTLTELEDPKIVSVIAKMLEKQADHSLSLLLSQENLFYELLDNVMEPIDKAASDKDKMDALTKKTKLSEEMENVSNRIEKYRSRYFRGDTGLEKKIRESFKYTPEGISRV